MRVCRWVWMVVRFVCVIRAHVCPVCPVCVPCVSRLPSIVFLPRPLRFPTERGACHDAARLGGAP